MTDQVIAIPPKGSINGYRTHRLRAPAFAARAALLAAFAALVLALTVTPAQASSTYVQAGSIEGFEFPLGGVAVDNASGDVYVVDGKNAVVDRYDASGTFISQFGGPGSGDGQFGQAAFGGPSGIAVDQSNGDVYVTDNVNNRVEKFDSSGTYLSQFDGSATPAGSFSTPTSVAVDPTDQSVYVVDAGNNAVDKFDSSGNVVAGFGSGGAIGGFEFPTFAAQPAAGVAVNSSGTLYVGDPRNGNGVVDEFSSSGGFLGQLGAGTLAEPSELAIDSADNIFAVDSSNKSIVEFDSAGNQLAGFPTNSPSTLRGVAVAADGLHVYVSTTAFFGAPSEVLIFALVTLPDATTAPASNPQQTTATLNGAVNPDGVALTDCHFAYTDEADFEANGYTGPDARTSPCVPAAASISPDHADHPVTAEATGLSPNTTYDFRLVAANANGAAHGQDLTFRTPGPPLIDSTSATDITSSEATLRAQINPEGSDTTYRFEFGTSPVYGQSVPVPDADIGAGTSDVAVSQPLQGLQPDTTYHFRVLATNALSPAGGTVGADQTFTTFAPPAAELPDGRGYELVTPPTLGGNALGERTPVFASSVSGDGDHVIYSSTEALPGSPNGLAGPYLATRTSSGWVTTPAMLPPGTPHPNAINAASDIAATPDYSTLLYEAINALDPNDQNGLSDVYALHVSDGSVSWLSQNGTVATGPERRVFVGSSADAGHVLFTNREKLTASDGAQVAGAALYERAGGRTRLVGLNSNGTLTSACGAILGDLEINPNLGGLNNSTGYAPGGYPVSRDGSRVFFESPDPLGSGDSSCSPAQGGTQPVELYLRQDAATTTEVSLSQRVGSVGVPAPTGATFVGATPDGSRVFFSSPDQLTDTAPPGGGLYRYDVASRALTFVLANVSVFTSDQDGSPMISPDGSRVYVVGGIPGNGPAGTNLYLWHSGTISLVSSPAPPTSVTEQPARMSGDGSTLAFTAPNNLLDYDSQGNAEIYLYREATGALVCISCDANGIAPTGSATLFGDGNFLPKLVSQNLSVDGGRLFFDSPDPLLPQATNGRRNIYEWEADGSGSCHSAVRSGGCLYLISNGNSPSDSLLVGASSDGRDVIFATVDRLAPQDRDGGEYSFYDARVGGGFSTPPTPNPCSGDRCQGVPSVQPPPPTAASISFSGPGNASSGAAAKVKVLSRVVHGARFLLRVRVPGKGRIAISGADVRRSERSFAKAGSYPLTVSLTSKAKRTLRYQHELKLRLRIDYAPSSGSASVATVSLTVKPLPGHRTKRARPATRNAGGAR